MRTKHRTTRVHSLSLSSDEHSSSSAVPHILRQEIGSSVLRDKRIVIVEDAGITQLQLRKICERAGMIVVGYAPDGQQGVQRALDTLPDIILMDIKMPGMSGLEAAEIILKRYAVCVVMLTAYDTEDHRARATLLGASGYIVKPVTFGSLIPQLEAAYKAFIGSAQ